MTPEGSRTTPGDILYQCIELDYQIEHYQVSSITQAWKQLDVLRQQLKQYKPIPYNYVYRLEDVHRRIRAIGLNEDTIKDKKMAIKAINEYMDQLVTNLN